MTIETSLTSTLVAEQRALIKGLLQTQRPTLDLSVGNPVESLLIDGNAVVSARLVTEVGNTAAQSNLAAIADGTVVVEDDVVDELMKSYFLERKQDANATGFVTVVVDAPRTYTFQAGFTFDHLGLTFSVATAFTAYPAGTVGAEETDTTTIIKTLFDSTSGFNYQFDVPVIADNPGSDYNLVTGDSLEAVSTSANIGRVFAATNFTGGQTRETNSEFVSRALSGLVNKSISGLENINALLPTIYPASVGSTVGTGDPIMTRDRQNLFGISTGGKLDLYVKTGAVASRVLLVDAVVTNFTARTAQITLNREQAAGAYRFILTPYFTTTPPAGITGDVTVTSSVNTVSAGTYFTPVLPQQIDMEFTARRTVTITFTDTRTTGTYVVPMTTNGQRIQGVYQLAIDYMPGILELTDALDSDSLRPANLDVNVKAAVPCFMNVGVVARRSPDYTGPSADTLAARLASAINARPLRDPQFDRFDVVALMNSLAPDLTVTAVSLTGSIYGQDGTTVALLPTSGALVVPTNTVAKISPLNVFFTACKGSVVVTLV